MAAHRVSLIFMSTQFEEVTLSTKRIHEGRIINLREDTVRLPSGREGRREIVEHNGAVCILPILDDGRVVLVRQYRKPAEETLLEIPAGGLAPDEEPLACAGRELKEECGFTSNKMTLLFSCFLAPGYSTELIHCFVAEELEGGDAEPEEDENLEIGEYSLEELLPMIDDGRIRDAKTIAGLLALYRRRNV